jgi:hypothetical protein
MRKQTALLLIAIAALLLLAGLTGVDDGDVLGRWLAALHSGAGQ